MTGKEAVGENTMTGPMSKVKLEEKLYNSSQEQVLTNLSLYPGLMNSLVGHKLSISLKVRRSRDARKRGVKA